MPRLVLRFICICFVVHISTACTGRQGTNDRRDTTFISIKGSDTMLLLVQRWAEEFMKMTSGVSIYVEGGGSDTGIRALIDGSIDIATVSRPWQPEEVKELVDRQGSLGFAVLSAKDALSIYLNPLNPVQSLSLSQIKGIFSGAIGNWQEVGGENESIVIINRNPNSGTYLFFEEHVLLGEEYRSDARNVSTTTAVVQAVSKDPAAIGYGGIAYNHRVSHCGVNGVKPTPENVRNGRYPISRYLYLYTTRPPRGVLKDFIDWVLSKEGQRIVKEVGYVPLYEVR